MSKFLSGLLVCASVPIVGFVDWCGTAFLDRRFDTRHHRFEIISARAAHHQGCAINAVAVERITAKVYVGKLILNFSQILRNVAFPPSAQ